MIIKTRNLFFIFLAIFMAACSGNEQYSKKITSNPFVSELFGETTKTIALKIDESDQIVWMGLEWSADYKYFEVTAVSYNGKDFEPDAEGSQALYENISLTESGASTNLSTSSGVSVANYLLATIKYSPLNAIEADNLPHKGYLLIATENRTGIIRVELPGYTQGICDAATEECNSVDTGSLTAKTYTLNQDGDGDGTSDFALYLCDPLITEVGQNNDEVNHANANIAYVNLDGNFTFYLNSDATEIHFAKVEAQNLEASIPEFEIPVPPGNYGESAVVPSNFSLDAIMEDGQDVSCAVEAGIFNCTGLELEVGGGIIGITPLEVTNGSTNPTSTDCTSFSAGISGSGSLDEDTISVVAWGVVNSSNNVPALLDALVVAVIPLKVVD
ncbi:MAG: hypothetical protein A3G32_08000 [Deltaproteobacteria bacterium RIFCSPLOWO2_12_FULL_40_28]|nr:MAG: hypothetical protein A3C45_00700 [Deltaproteobacteria bacterium RIFCSPHIGHO2_02_FULL_40_28]OGQ20854.1 MAG: hypothetical protein A3E27_03365 [Deltaproteobacteria bacterium RIFCSPHIGHO2_12_FULL_40_32]OGQ39255.1 MAG: hypothetical protein A3I69_04725 [Deltaproteobacteria bacterium RIFCSPLOWO2_02_FULL_40_36]OGQ54536.1 MAG: hypothetical protein A3G32_08000 [Deltaproteobacteria bacterium RIFCSPLOWO2_12_FULL_40_28]